MNEQNEEYYRQKYLKYKAKYLALQEQSGSGFASAIKAFLSLNGTYLIFHNTDFTTININNFMKDYIPIDNNNKNVTINIDILKKFDGESNKQLFEKIFNNSVIVHIYKPLLSISNDYHIEIAEFNHYLSKKAKIDLNFTKYLKNNLSLFNNVTNVINVTDVQEILNKINNNNDDVKKILTIIQNFSIKKLNEYYHEKIQSSGIGKPKISLIDYYKQKYPKSENYITDYSALEEIFLSAVNNNYKGPPILSSVFIMDKVTKIGLSVKFNVRNVQL
jgi:hypothetical protein